MGAVGGLCNRAAALVLVADTAVQLKCTTRSQSGSGGIDDFGGRLGWDQVESRLVRRRKRQAEAGGVQTLFEPRAQRPRRNRQGFSEAALRPGQRRVLR